MELNHDVSDVPSAEKDKCVRVSVMFEGAEEETGSIVPIKRKKLDAESSVNVEDRIPRKSDPYENPLSYKKTKKDREEVVGWRVKVWWPLNDKYHEGVIESYDHATDNHKVVYLDGDIEYLKLKHRLWYRVDAELDSQHNQGYAEQPWRFLEQSPGARRISVRFEDSEDPFGNSSPANPPGHGDNKGAGFILREDIETEIERPAEVGSSLQEKNQGYAKQPKRFLEKADGARRISVRFE